MCIFNANQMENGFVFNFHNTKLMLSIGCTKYARSVPTVAAKAAASMHVRAIGVDDNECTSSITIIKID